MLTALLGALLYLVVFRPLRDAPPLARAVASLGVMIVIQSVMAITVGTAPVVVKAIFPVKRWEWGSLTVLSDRFYLAVTIVVVTIVLSLVFQLHPLRPVHPGLGRVADRARSSAASPPTAVALINWMISATIAGLAGILIAPISPLTPISYTLFVIPALAAALVGGFQYLVPTVARRPGHRHDPGRGAQPGRHRTRGCPRPASSELVPLIVILIALTVTGQAMPARGGLLRQPLGRAPAARGRILFPAVVGFAVGVRSRWCSRRARGATR